MRSYLRLIRAYRRLLRRLFGGKPPHWYRDSLRALRFLNLGAVLGTYLCIFIAPRHFFGRVDRIAKDKDKLHRTPVAFFFASLALYYLYFKATAALLPEDKELDELRKLWMGPNVWDVLTMVVTAPLIAWLFALTLYILEPVVRGMFDHKRTRIDDRSLYAVAVSPSSYLNLNWSRYLWGLFYLSVYSFFTFQIVFLLGLTAVVASIWLMALHTMPQPVGYLVFITQGLIYLLWVVATKHLLIMPYVESLRASQRKTTPRLLKTNLLEVKRAMDNLSQWICTAETDEWPERQRTKWLVKIGEHAIKVGASVRAYRAIRTRNGHAGIAQAAWGTDAVENALLWSWCGLDRITSITEAAKQASVPPHRVRKIIDALISSCPAQQPQEFVADFFDPKSGLGKAAWYLVRMSFVVGLMFSLTWLYVRLRRWGFA